MGEYPKEDSGFELLKMHIADCDRCISILKEIRPPHQVQPVALRLLTSKALFVAVLALLIAVGSFWFFKSIGPSIETVDLRQVTRGVEAPPIDLHRNATSIRILLPRGNPADDYEAGIFSLTSRLAPIRAASGHANVENQDVVLTVPLSLKDLKPGAYLLGIRHGSEWAEYTINVR